MEDGMMNMAIIMIKMDRLKILLKKTISLMINILALNVPKIIMMKMSFKNNLEILGNIMNKKIKTHKIIKSYKR